jgi:hypothetical protein
MILDTATRTLEIVLGEAMTTSNCDITASYAMTSQTSFVTAAASLVSNGTTAVTVVPAPDVSTQIQVNEVRLHNNDTVTHVVTLRLNDNGTRRVVLTQILAAGRDFLYTPASGGAVSITSSDVIAALSYTPYNATNPSGYQTAANVNATLASPPAIGGTAANAATFTSVNTGPLAGFRNAVTNGGMDVWQRGTSIAATNGAYLADRWKTLLDGSGSTATVSRVAWALDTGTSWSLSYAVTVAGSGGTYRQLLHPIEDVRTYSGKQVTVSFWATTASGTATVGIWLQQYFGTGGSPSASVNQTVQNITATTTPTRYSATFTLPTIVGKTLGSNNDHYLGVVFNLPVNTVVTVAVTDVQVEPGPVSTPFEIRPQQIEFALCQRHFQTGSTTLQGYGVTGTGISITHPLPVVMRVAPTLTPTASNTNLTSPVLGAAADHLGAVGTVTATGNFSLSYTWTASAEL